MSTILELVGLSVADATKLASEHGFELRVAWQDGYPFPYSADYDITRLNVEVTGGKVSRILDFG